ncbi:hypothetical protein K7X08_017241 [Anisodus acutangulus]|uniref:Uncharacterized protein n=1 Tax=Anisodus acutangulus TaxID=402998 RepID=A0A9Q1LTD5_9SOLA|nr:hypothetical protein K7X08_017241 [Anisodus acutangulus]
MGLKKKEGERRGKINERKGTSRKTNGNIKEEGMNMIGKERKLNLFKLIAAFQNIEEEVVDLTKTSNTKEVAYDAHVVGSGENNHTDTAHKEGKNVDKHNESQGVKTVENESAK